MNENESYQGCVVQDPTTYGFMRICHDTRANCWWVKFLPMIWAHCPSVLGPRRDSSSTTCPRLQFGSAPKLGRSTAHPVPWQTRRLEATTVAWQNFCMVSKVLANSVKNGRHISALRVSKGEVAGCLHMPFAYVCMVQVGFPPLCHRWHTFGRHHRWHTFERQNVVCILNTFKYFVPEGL